MVQGLGSRFYDLRSKAQGQERRVNGWGGKKPWFWVSGLWTEFKV
jgi:hypothetical protein